MQNKLKKQLAKGIKQLDKGEGVEFKSFINKISKKYGKKNPDITQTNNKRFLK